MSSVYPPLQRLPPGDGLPWHQHDGAYVAIVLEGGYSEAGDDGRRVVRAGDVVVHQPYSGHANLISSGGAVIVNCALSWEEVRGLSSGCCGDPETLAAEMRAGYGTREGLLRDSVRPTKGADDLPDLLAEALRTRTHVRLDEWAYLHGVPQRTLRRQFAQAYGMSPATYRARSRARRAFRHIVDGELPLAELSYQLGFADQAHLSRALRQLTGQSPRAVRRNGRLVQD